MTFRSIRLAAAAAGFLLALSVPAVSAHTHVVQPPSQDDPVVSQPISNPWAQAHCNAASPAIVVVASNGVNRFNPGITLPCPLVPNPGGQVHGD